MNNENQDTTNQDAGSQQVAARKSMRTVRGVVLSAKMQKTLVVVVNRKVRHPIYEKFVTQETKLYAHDELGEAKIGDTVEIAPTRRLSKLKNWRLVRIVQKAAR
jgi:small subunit ribosomal protein S17